MSESPGHRLTLEEHGATHFPAVIDAATCRVIAAACTGSAQTVGRRVFGNSALQAILGPRGPIGAIATAHLGDHARPVRALFFDKTAEKNWAVPWHQDRTIAVRDRCDDTPGFGPWSRKNGVHHVEPPAQILASMVTLRLHLDEVTETNAPLLIACGSHRLGRIPQRDVAYVVARHRMHMCGASIGDVWAFATLIVHASRRAHADDHNRHRRVLHVDYANHPLPHGLEWAGI
ncbi:MAG: phytanoyl-CoA dioxygenase family protein [Pseudomonadota bacterium]